MLDPQARAQCLKTALAAMLMVLVWQFATVRFNYAGNWSGLFCTGSEVPLPPELNSSTARIPGLGYDGQYYRLVAHDPLLKQGYAPFADSVRHRWSRILIPVAAFTLAGGSHDRVDAAYIALMLIFLGAGVYWSAVWLAGRGQPPWYGLIFLALPGALVSVDRMLLDGPLAALFAAFLVYSDDRETNSPWPLLAVCAAAPLIRETGFVFCLAAAFTPIIRRSLWLRAAALATALSGLVWTAWIAQQSAPLPIKPLLIPATGLVMRFFQPRPGAILAVTDFVALAGMTACLVIGTMMLLRRQILWETAALAPFLLIGIAFGDPGYMQEPYGFVRPLAPLALALSLHGIIDRNWIAIAAPLGLSVGVGVSFLWQIAGITRGLLR